MGNGLRPVGVPFNQTFHLLHTYLKLLPPRTIILSLRATRQLPSPADIGDDIPWVQFKVSRFKILGFVFNVLSM